MAKRVIWIVLDSAGIGEEPDADKFGDVGSDTFGHILETYPDAKFDNLTKLGLRAIENTSFYDAATKQDVIGVYGKAQELSNGKDTTTGHWEMIIQNMHSRRIQMDSHRRLSMHLSSRLVVEPSTETKLHPAFRSLRNTARNT